MFLPPLVKIFGACHWISNSMVSSLPVVLHVSHLARPCVAFHPKGTLWPVSKRKTKATVFSRHLSRCQPCAVPLAARLLRLRGVENNLLDICYVWNLCNSWCVSKPPKFWCCQCLSDNLNRRDLWVTCYGLYSIHGLHQKCRGWSNNNGINEEEDEPLWNLGGPPYFQTKNPCMSMSMENLCEFLIEDHFEWRI